MFPSATTSAGKNSSKDNAHSWLENKSFEEKAASLIRSKQQELGAVLDKLEPVLIQEKHLISDESSSGADSNDEDESLSEATEVHKINDENLVIDTSCDKNNLYFKKPYKVFIPKFYRGSTVCCGLSPYYTMTFKENKRKRKKVVPDRYFHSKFLQDTDEELVDISDMKSEIERLNILTREEPNNISVWMQLVNLQDKIGGKNVRVTTEKKIAVLDKAISSNPRNVDLKLERLQQFESVSEDSEREWKDLVFQHPGNRKAWEAYILHSKKQASHNISKTLKVFERCIQTCSAIHEGSFQPKEPCPDVENDMMEIFAQLVHFLSECGHIEICVTLLIVMVEVNVRTKNCSSVSDVKGFYESGEPLLGEDKSSGWEPWSLKHKKGGWVKVEEPEKMEVSDDDLDVDFDKGLEENWLTMEEKRTLRDLLPLRTNEECEDPARKVSFDDIQGFIFFVKEISSRIKILRLLVSFLGIKIENGDSFKCISQLCHISHSISSQSLPGDISYLRLSCDPLTCPCGLLPREPHHTFLCKAFDQLRISCPKEVTTPVSCLYLDYLHARLIGLSKNKNYKQQLKHSHKEAKKIARNLLQSDPMNFELWIKFANIEAIAGKHEDCKKVYFNALCMCKSQRDALALCGSYTKLSHEKHSDALCLALGALGDNQAFADYLQSKKGVTSAVVLRATRNLERICEELSCLYKEVDDSLTLKASQFADAVCCYGMYLKLTSNLFVPQALQPYIVILRKQHSTGSKQAAIDLLQVHNLITRLVDRDYKHQNHYRNAVLSALDDFPENPLFATQLCKVEIGASVASVARRLFGTLETPLKSIYAVYFEILRSGHSSGTNQPTTTPRILNLLERAVTVHQSDVFLWRLYAACTNNPDDILIRATSNCSWSKAIACDRIRSSKQNIDEIIKFTKDKGLRVRTPIEEVRLLLTM
uniref:Protein NRDE2 homolog n=1 Tax=Phallusia mammillata TaxID=59560 RepID=A0A6F9DMM7_9ASCI|nr:protein NRDE2 homolog [Phallusia mammillata]